MPLGDVDWWNARLVKLVSDTDSYLTRPAEDDETAFKLSIAHLIEVHDGEGELTIPDVPDDADTIDYYRALEEVADEVGYDVLFLGTWADTDQSTSQPNHPTDLPTGAEIVSQSRDEHAVYVLRMEQSGTDEEFWKNAQQFQKPDDYGRPDFLMDPSSFTPDYFEGERDRTQVKSVKYPHWNGYYPSWLAFCYYADTVLYVGETHCLQQRLWDHFYDQDESNLGRFDSLTPVELLRVEWHDSRSEAQRRENELAQELTEVKDAEPDKPVFQPLRQYGHC